MLVLVCELVRQAGHDLNAVLSRCCYGSRAEIDLASWLNLVGENRAARTRSDLHTLFGFGYRIKSWKDITHQASQK